MHEIFNVGDTILLDDQALSLVTVRGVSAWIEKGATFTYRHDQVVDSLDGQTKYRRIYDKEGDLIPFALVQNHEEEDGGRVILFKTIAEFDAIPDLP